MHFVNEKAIRRKCLCNQRGTELHFLQKKITFLKK